MASTLRKFFSLFLILGLVAGVTGCGVRGPLEPPPSAKKAKSGPEKPGEEKKADVDENPFILDGLLR